jgi:outer membrane lipoprotein carrier protein
MKPLISRLFLAFGLLLTCAASAGGVHSPQSSQKLDGLLAPLESLSARFTQTITDADGYELQTLTGTMTVARPGKVFWQSDAPYEQLVVSDATTLWLYDKDLEQVTIRPFDADIARTPAVLFIGKVENLEQKYRVSSLDESNITTFTLIPIDPAALYQKVALSFKGKTPVAMNLWDSLGQQTRIDFTKVKVNKKVKASLFTFTVPPGVDVLQDQ